MRNGIVVPCAMLMCVNSLQAELKPLMTVPAEVVVADDFEKPHKLDKAVWQRRQGTVWGIEDGVLRGKESPAEYQASRTHHQGFAPRISIPATPANFVASFSVRFDGGKEDAIVPFVEFGHHVCRVRFHSKGLELLAEGESVILAATDKIRYEPGRWYHCLAEMKNGHFVLQIEDGPTLYAYRKSFAEVPLSGGNGIGVAGPQHGTVEIDNLSIRNVKAQLAESWSATLKALPQSEPVVIPAKRKKFEEKQAAAE